MKKDIDLMCWQAVEHLAGAMDHRLRVAGAQIPDFADKGRLGGLEKCSRDIAHVNEIPFLGAVADDGECCIVMVFREDCKRLNAQTMPLDPKEFAGGKNTECALGGFSRRIESQVCCGDPVDGEKMRLGFPPTR